MAFETRDDHAGRWHQPIRVPTLKADVLSAAREMCDDLGWRVVGVDEDRCAITCERRNGPLSGTSTIVVSVEGPDGIPSSTVHARSETSGGVLSRDKANVTEFVKKFTMRVC